MVLALLAGGICLVIGLVLLGLAALYAWEIFG